MAILCPKIGQRHFGLGAHASHGQNLAIFHPILTKEYTQMTSSSRRTEWNKNLSSISLLYIYVFGPHFCSKASHGQCCTQNYPRIVGTCPGHHGQLMSQNCIFTKIRGEPPPPPLKSNGHVGLILFLFLFSSYFTSVVPTALLLQCNWPIRGIRRVFI